MASEEVVRGRRTGAVMVEDAKSRQSGVVESRVFGGKRAELVGSGASFGAA